MENSTNSPMIVIVGILFVIIGFFLQNNLYEFNKKAKSTQATLYAANKTIVNGEDKYDIYAKYKINGKNYTTMLYHETTLGKITIGPITIRENIDGETITIYYDPDSPETISTSNTSQLGNCFMIVGTIFAVLSVGTFIFSKIKK